MTDKNKINLNLEHIIKIDDLKSFENIEKMMIYNLIKNINSKNKINDSMMWHIRLGHASLKYMQKLQKIEGALSKVKFDESILNCEVCIMAKMDKIPFIETRTRASKPLQYTRT